MLQETKLNVLLLDAPENSIEIHPLKILPSTAAVPNKLKSITKMKLKNAL